MALTITSIEKLNSGACDHVTVEVNQDGETRVFGTHLQDIDNYFGSLSQLEQLKMLVILWAKYRRATGRQILNVEIG